MAVFPIKLSNLWNVFASKPKQITPNIGRSYSMNPDRAYLSRGNERSIVSSLYNRIALDVAALDIRHCKLNEEGQYVKAMDSGLQRCLSISANIDQTPRQFIQDLVLTMFDEGVAAVVPVDLDVSPIQNNSYDIKSVRVGRIREWYPHEVRIDVYNDRTGDHEELTLPKSMVAIVENPLYAVINEPNSTLQRLIRKLNLLDVIDEQSSSGKMDLIIQLPYVIKSDAKRAEAERRRKDIENQLMGSRYGIAYTDGTERITQLNRPVENNLLEQIKYLQTMLYGQLGISENIANGTGSEEETLNYHNRTLEPIISAICDAMKRTFLTQTAISQGQTVKFFRDPFKLVPVEQLAEIADKFTRNEIMSSNEFRSVMGFPRVNDPAADELRNKNLNKADSGSDDENFITNTPEDARDESEAITIDESGEGIQEQ